MTLGYGGDNVDAGPTMASGCPRQPGFRRQARRAPELGEVVRDQRQVESQGVGGNPEVVGAEKLTDRDSAGMLALRLQYGT